MGPRTVPVQGIRPVAAVAPGEMCIRDRYLLIGFLLGGVLACGVVVVKFLLDGMVYSASELNLSLIHISPAGPRRGR